MPDKSIAYPECEKHREAIHGRINMRLPRWVFLLIVPLLIVLVVGSYAFAWRSTGVLSDEMHELQRAVDKNSARWEALFAVVKEMKVELIELRREVKEVHETVIRIERNNNGGP